MIGHVLTQPGTYNRLEVRLRMLRSSGDLVRAVVVGHIEFCPGEGWRYSELGSVRMSRAFPGARGAAIALCRIVGKRRGWARFDVATYNGAPYSTRARVPRDIE